MESPATGSSSWTTRSGSTCGRIVMGSPVPKHLLRNYAACRGAWGAANPRVAPLRKELPHAADGGPEGTLIYFHEVDKGGHFAAWEQPELLYEELRAAFRSLREPEQGTG